MLTICQKRKAQNRAAQRAFRDRKEKHLKDLETKVDGLEKASEAANHENGLLKAQVERLQVELKEYRKRLSWISNQSNGKSPTQASTQKTVNSSNDFQFEFPKFGDLPAMSSTNMFNNSSATTQNRSSSMTSAQARSNGIPKTANPPRANSTGQQQQRQGSATQSPVGNTFTGSPQSMSQQQSKGSVDSLSGLFSPSILEATRQASMGGYFPQTNSFAANSRNSQTAFPNNAVYSNSTTSNSDSPGSSTESQNAISSIGTSPEPSLSSPGNKMQDFNLNTIDENQMSNTFGKDELCKQLSRTCGCVDDPIPPILNQNLSNDLSLGFNNTFGNASLNNTYDLNASWLPADAGTNFDPVLFGDYRETQDNILSQDFGSFFNDAYPLPDLGSPLHNYNDVIAPEQTSSGIMAMPQKIDLIRQVDAAKDGSEEVVPNTDKPLSCNKIWYIFTDIHSAEINTDSVTRDRLQSMEKFRNGEIDIDNLCSELRAKAKCSEGGAVVDKRDVDKILGK